MNQFEDCMASAIIITNFGLQFNSLLSHVSRNGFSDKYVLLKSFKNVTMNEVQESTDIITKIDSNPYASACKPESVKLQKQESQILNDHDSYNTGDKLVFNKSSNDLSVLGKCWAKSENFGTWSDGLESSIRLPFIRKNNNNVVIRFVFLPYINSQRKQAAVKLIIAGKPIVQWLFTKPGRSTRQVVIPADVLTQNTIELRFRHDNPVTPYELGLGKNSRYLNIAIISLELISE